MSGKHNTPRPLPESLGLPFSGADAHAHLNSRGLLEQLPAVMDRAGRAGVRNIAQVFCGLDAYREHKDAFLPYPEIVFCLGVHPDEAATFTGALLAGLRAAFKADGRLRAVGEIGLDFHENECPPLVQEEAFRLQLRLARELDLPVVIHSRDAAVRTLALLEDEGFAGRPLLWHCFSGDAVAHAGRIAANGWHVSIPGPVTYPANGDLRAAVAGLPPDRLLIETDCPYLAPVPWRGKSNEPALAAFTAAMAADVRGMAAAELWTLAGDNMRRFFNIDHVDCKRLSRPTGRGAPESGADSV